jgi:carbon monoxide dehydrogenase subunit G
MTRLHERIQTRLNPEAAFAYIADFANASAWDPGIATSEREDGGPLGVGSRFRLGVRMGGRVLPMLYRITVYDAPRRVVVEGDGSGVHAIDEIRFESSGDGTAVDYTADIRLGGILGLAQPFLGGALDRLAKAALGGMKTTLDDLAGELGPAR